MRGLKPSQVAAYERGIARFGWCPPEWRQLYALVAMRGRLAEHFDEAQLVELTAVAAFENYMARFNRGFDVQAEGFSEGATCPLPDHHAARRREPNEAQLG